VRSPVGRRRSLTRRRDGWGSLVTGPVDWPPVAFAAPDRSIGASLLRFRSHPFDVHWPCRAVRKVPPPGPSRFGVRLRPVGTQAVGRVALAVFVPRVSGCLKNSHFPRARHVRLQSSRAAVETSPVRVIRGWCSSDSARTGPASGQFSRPGRWRFSRRRRRPWDLLITLRSVAPASVAGERAFFASRSGPPAVSPRVPPRVPSIAGSGFCAGSRGRRPRLLGFGPAGQPSPRCRRSRYSFCA
jgi:hypothetical protein